MNRQAAESTRNHTAQPMALWPVLLVNFIGSLGLSIVIPFLVFVVRDWGGNALVYGFMASTYPTFQLFGAPVLGRLSDRIGRRKVLLVSQAGTLLSWLVFAAAFFLPELVVSETSQFVLTLPLCIVFIARALDGLTGGNVSVANAYVSDISTDKTRGRNFGWMAASSSTGFVVGPAVAGMLGSTVYGELLPVLMAAMISLIATLVIFFVLPESNPCAIEFGKTEESLRRTLGQETKDCFDNEDDSRAWKQIVKQPHVPLMLLLYLLIFLAFNLFYTAFPNQAAVNLDWDVGQVGWFFTLLSGLMVLVQGPVLGWLSKYVTPPKLVLSGGILMSGSFSLLVLSHASTTYASAIVFAAGNGIMWPSYMAMLSRTGEQRMQGSIQGLATSAGGAASIVGLISGGVLFTLIGASTFVIAAVVIAVAAVMAMRLNSVFSRPLNEVE